MQKLKLNRQLFEKVSTLIKTGCCNCYEENCLLLDDGETHTALSSYHQVTLSADIFLNLYCRMIKHC